MNSPTMNGPPSDRAAEQAARRTAGERLPCPQRHLLDAAVRRAAARSARELWAIYDLLQSLRSWRRAGVWGGIMNALAATHDAAVQMIDTSIVRVH